MIKDQKISVFSLNFQKTGSLCGCNVRGINLVTTFRARSKQTQRIFNVSTISNRLQLNRTCWDGTIRNIGSKSKSTPSATVRISWHEHIAPLTASLHIQSHHYENNILIPLSLIHTSPSNKYPSLNISRILRHQDPPANALPSTPHSPSYSCVQRGFERMPFLDHVSGVLPLRYITLVKQLFYLVGEKWHGDAATKTCDLGSGRVPGDGKGVMICEGLDLRCLLIFFYEM